MIDPLFYRSCPICGGAIKASRLEQGLPCERHEVGENRLLEIEEAEEEATKTILEVEKHLRDFEDLFYRAVGSRIRSVQRMRAKRLLARRNFSILAPTGMGKSTFIGVAALYFAKSGKKTLIVLPTRVLVKQTAERLREMSKRAGIEAKIVAYGVDKDAKKKLSDFDILIVTTAFITSHVERGLRLLDLVRERFKAIDLILVDDVDAILKGSKNVRRILSLLGIKEEALEEARRLREAKDREALERLKREIERGSERYTVGKLGQLIVSTATGRVGKKARELFDLLNFSVGSSREGLRRVVDVYMLADPLEGLKKIAKKLKDGFFVFLPTGEKEKIPEVVEILKALGISAGDDSKLEEFLEGKLNALVGTAYYYGRLVRGIDEPRRIKYVVFLGVPKFRISYQEKASLGAFLALAYAILPALIRLKSELRVRVRRVLRRLQHLTQSSRRELSEMLRDSCENGYLKHICEEIKSVRRELLEIVRANPEAIDRHTVVKISENYIEIPDIRTYLQASGRTSRLYAGGITKGLSVVIERDRSLLDKFVKRSSILFGIKRHEYEESLIDKTIEEIEAERQRLDAEGEYDPVKPILFIVESPNKARTIASYFGRPGRISIGSLNAYEVNVGDKLLIIAATGGHVYDLIERDIEGNDYFGIIKAEKIIPQYAPILRCEYKISSVSFVSKKISRLDNSLLESVEPKEREEIESRVRVPIEKISCEEEEREDYKVKLVRALDKKEIIDALRRLAYETGEAYIATDPDIEGEFIGRSIATNLRPFVKSIKRAEFHEVTVKAILEALESPKELDKNRIYAQIARRIEDRLIGFGLSKRLQEMISDEDIKALSKEIVDSLLEALEAEDIAREANKRIREIISDERLKLLLTVGTLSTFFLEIYYRYKRGEEKEAIREEISKKLEDILKRRRYSLSAGRVQTPVLGRIVERSDLEKAKLYVIELEGFKISVGGYKKELSKEVEEAIIRLKHGGKIKIEKQILSEEIFLPPPPYTTDTLLSDASRILGFSPEETMSIAQDLFELGLITYHRTDSTRVSSVGISLAREYIKDKLGEELFKPRERLPKEKDVQGAHECIRPTKPLDVDDLRAAIQSGDIERPLSSRHYKLYDLIFRRFIASEMKEERGLRVSYRYIANGVVIKETSEYEIPKPSSRSLIRRPAKRIAEGEYKVRSVKVRPDLATEDRIISEMRARGIGRPSTYARIVEKIKEKKYATEIKLGRGKGLKVTPRGRIVYEKVTEKFGSLVSEERTKRLVENMTLIESGRKKAHEVIEELFEEFENYILKEL